jgi:hypothetical protein
MSMTELLGVLDLFPDQTLKDLRDNLTPKGLGYNPARTEFALYVITQRQLPTSVPDDVKANGQDTEAQKYLDANP